MGTENGDGEKRNLIWVGIDPQKHGDLPETREKMTQINIQSINKKLF